MNTLENQGLGFDKNNLKKVHECGIPGWKGIVLSS